MNTQKYKVGDKIKVISQGWGKSSLVGRIGIIFNITPSHLCIYFKGWEEGHKGEGDPKNFREAHPYSFYNLGTKERDVIVPIAPIQFEFNFNEKI
jgi:hypothetical protein